MHAQCGRYLSRMADAAQVPGSYVAAPGRPKPNPKPKPEGSGQWAVGWEQVPGSARQPRRQGSGLGRTVLCQQKYRTTSPKILSPLPHLDPNGIRKAQWAH